MLDTSFLLQFLLWLLGCAALVSAIRAFLAGRAGTWRRRLAVAGIVVAALGVGLSVVQFANFLGHDIEDAETADGNCYYLALAMHNYRDDHGRFPPAFHASPQGCPLLSWRVLLLPYIEQYALYRKFHLEEPWDSAHNSKLLKEMPSAYAAPRWGVQPGPSYTYWHVFVGETAAFTGAQGLRYPEDFPDEPENTILLVMGGPPVPWSKPDDIDYGPEIPLPNLFNVRPGGFLAAMCDARVHFVKTGVSERSIRAAVTRNGGEKLEPLWWSH
jgi:hypothetical protein